MESSADHTTHPHDGRRTLVVMAKAPRPGTVKTRLLQSLPVEAVTELYRCLMDDTISLARSLGTVEVAMMCPASDVGELTSLVRGRASVVAQKGAGLAAGLTSVFAHFTAPGGQRVVAFNSDSPHLPPSVLDSAFEVLLTRDLVVGPTHDGGYYLVGAKDTHPALFEGDGMGTQRALDVLLARARSMELTVGFTDAFYDIDVASDLVRLAAELKLAPARAPRTAAWMQQRAPALAQMHTGAGEL